MEKNEVVEYIESVKDPVKFVEYCRKYHEEEPRDIAYVVSSSIASRDPNNISFILVGAKLIIVTWNVAGFQRLPWRVRIDLENDILNAYSKIRERFES